MKKRRSSQLAFLNPRVLIGLFMALARVFLALAGLGAFSALAQVRQEQRIVANSNDPLVPHGFDCSKIHELGIDKQENFRAGAIMIACGLSEGGMPFLPRSKHRRQIQSPHGQLDSHEHNQRTDRASRARSAVDRG
jgi:hypothetical protein